MTNTRVKVKKPKISEEEKREKIRDALMKKKSFQENALRLVEQLMKPNITRDFLLQSTSVLNQGFYQDCVEERSLTGVCGYPICDNVKPSFEKKGKFHISLKDKKVYDLAERKLFCSSQCFKASTFLKEQLETSPLWMQENVKTFQNIKLLDATTGDADQRLKGDCLNISIAEKKDPNEQSIPEHDMNELENKKSVSVLKEKNYKPKATKTQSQLPKDVVSKAIKEWFTIDTYRFLFGEENLKTRLRECGASEETWAASIGDKELAEQYQAKYRELCRKLDILDMREEADGDGETERLPMPSFEMLKKHCREENSKMEAFLAGKQSFSNSLVADIREKESEAEEPRIPLLDHRAQQQLRRKLVFDYVSRTAPEVLKLLHLRTDDTRTDLKELVNTFKLEANNVVFKTEEWTLIFVFLLKMISNRNILVKDSWEEEEHQKKLTLVLMSYQFDMAHMEQVIREITADIKFLVAKCHV